MVTVSGVIESRWTRACVTIVLGSIFRGVGVRAVPLALSLLCDLSAVRGASCGALLFLFVSIVNHLSSLDFVHYYDQ